MTPISSLGEFGLIQRLTDGLPQTNATTIKGVGDDCAVLGYGPTRQLVTTDMLLEGVHFDLVYTPLKHLGYKAVAVNLSDIYAMGGTPRQLLVSIAVDRRISVESLDELYAGIRLCCQRYGVDLVGGDTSSSLTGLTLTLTAIGEAPEEDVVYRHGARDTDLLCVSGNLGAAYLGLQLLEREKKVFAGTPQDDETAAQPDFSGHEYLLERYLKPEPRRDIIDALRQANIHPTAMIDISDGLSSELLHICQQSECGCRIYEDRLPIDYQTALCAEEFNLNVSTCALNGGEDYELLFAAPLSSYEQLTALADVHVIGHVTRPELGCKLVTRGEAEEVEIRAQGWTHHDNKDAE